MNVIGYDESGMIRVEIDSVEMTVPDDAGNRHRQEIAEWEVAGNTIPSYQPPAPLPSGLDYEHDRRATLGKTFDVPGYGGIPLEGSLRTQTVLLALKDTARDLAAAGITDPVLFFTDRDNGDHYLTPAQVIDMVDQGKTFMQALHEAKRALKGMDPIPVDYADERYWPAA